MVYDYLHMHTVLVAQNSILSLPAMAEVKYCKFDKVFNSTALYLAGMLHIAEGVSCNLHTCDI